jgi:branched-chain amino acid transport system ATP-binding protein
MLSVRDLEAGYGDAKVLRKVSIEVERGEVVTVIGPNGAGKSTLLMAITGSLPPTSGSIEFLGERIHGISVHEAVKKGLVFGPSFRVFPYMTVKENLLMGAWTVKEKSEVDRRLMNIQEEFPILAERSSQLAHTLSGGQRQMLAVSRCLMSNPKLLLLDEPSFGLSPIMLQTISKLITRLRERGLTILVAEQNANLALTFADRGYVLEGGQVRLHGAAEELARSDHVRKAYLGL